jgi:nucleotide-binding universal stress UspA family protein
MQRILAAVDSSTRSSAVVARAVAVAKATGGKVRILQVVGLAPPLTPPAMFVPPALGQADALVAEARAFVDELAAHVPEALRDGVAVEIGEPAQRIREYATTYDASIVVIGAHHYTLIERIFGTTPASVANQIDRPVLIVPSNGAAAPGLPKTPHAGLGAGVLAGVTTGAVVGAIAGPLGVVVGGALGAAGGAIAGQVIDQETARDERHDRELDDDIGVSAGDLGAKEKAAEALTTLEKEQAQRA